MRVGNYKSASYRRVMSHRSQLKRKKIDRLCHRLDRLVERYENMRRGGATRKHLEVQADLVREKLRKPDH